jgi:hypothetical protein
MCVVAHDSPAIFTGSDLDEATDVLNVKGDPERTLGHVVEPCASRLNSVLCYHPKLFKVFVLFLILPATIKVAQESLALLSYVCCLSLSGHDLSFIVLRYVVDKRLLNYFQQGIKLTDIVFVMPEFCLFAFLTHNFHLVAKTSFTVPYNGLSDLFQLVL